MRIFKLAAEWYMVHRNPVDRGYVKRIRQSVLPKVDALLQSDTDIHAAFVFAAKYSKIPTAQEFLVQTLFPNERLNFTSSMWKNERTEGSPVSSDVAIIDQVIVSALLASKHFRDPVLFIKSGTAINLAAKRNPSAFEDLIQYIKKSRSDMSGEGTNERDR